MTARPNRRIVALAALAALVVVAVIAVTAYRLGQDTTNAPAPSGTATPSTAASGSSPSPAPGSPSTGSSQPGLPQGPARAGEGGRMTGPAGLPLGYDRTQTGAVQAATNYLSWMTSLRIKDKNTADTMAEATTADPATRAAVVVSLDQLRSSFEGMTEASTEPARGAYAVKSYDGSTASVYVWAPFRYTSPAGGSTTSWGVSEVRLVWHDDWKLDGTLVNRVGSAAADPANPEGNPTSVEKQSILSRTPADPGEITDTAQQDWLEYGNAAR